jgi:hypothetical protein
MTDTTQLNDALAANYMLVDLEISSWSGRQTDREASSEFIAAKGAARDSGRFVKYLFASADAELTAVHRAGAAIRHFVYHNTLPWSGNTDGTKRGSRLLPAVKAIEFLGALHAVKQDYDKTVETLVSVWDQRVAQAQANLAGLADTNDYPSAQQVAKMFSMRVDLRPMPSEQDFSRINLPAALIQALGERHAKSLSTQMENAHADLKERLLKEIQRMATQLGKAGAGEKTRLHDTLNTNLQGLVGLLRTMNATGKPELNALADRIEKELLSVPVDAFRNSKAKAAEVAQAASQIALDAAMKEVWEL